MKHIIALLIFTFSIGNNLLSQQHRQDTRIQILKEDANNMYKSDQITNLDLIEALELSGITICKFNLGSFDKKYNFIILIDEFKDGKSIKSDTVYNYDNEYTYFTEGEKNYYTDYFEQLKIYSKVADTTLTHQFNFTGGMSFPYTIQFKKYSIESYYYFRSYLETNWSLNEKIPLLIFASSWKDKQGGFQRFCGVVNLSRNDIRTDELLSSSPHYFMISYLVREIKE